MKQTIGSAARGENYYPRPHISAEIIVSLGNESNIYLSGPRRIGKTSIMYYFQDNMHDTFHFIYTITESVDDENSFYKVLFEELLKSDEVSGFIKAKEKLKEFGLAALDMIEEVGSIKLKERKETDYYKDFCTLLQKLELAGRKVVIMVDEFPQTIQNIQEKHGADTAKKFIQRNRELRHLPELVNKIKFIYTGSISLYPMVEKICELTEINDLFNVPVNPLSKEQATELIRALLEEKKLAIAQKEMDYLLKKIKWLIPFHCQLMVHEISLLTPIGSPITNELIDTAFNRIVDNKYGAQFKPYFSRLKKFFKGNEYKFVMELLGQCARHDTTDKLNITNLATKYKIANPKFIVTVLSDDGYITKEGKEYRFNSPLLQEWCKKYIYEEEDL